MSPLSGDGLVPLRVIAENTENYAQEASVSLLLDI